MSIKQLAPLLAKQCDLSDMPPRVVTRPWDGEVMAEVKTVGTKGVDCILENAYNTYRKRSECLPLHQRIEIIEKVCQAMGEHGDALARQAAAEGGKPLIDSQVELARAIVTLRSCIDYLRSGAAHGRRIPMQLNPASINRLAYTVKEPIGVVLAFSAFNHPINLIAHQIGPAIAAGCPVVIKPAEATPVSCFSLVEMFYEAGLPRTHCQAMLVDNHEIAAQCVSDPRVGFFSFIGSGRVGWQLKSKLTSGARCALEHGGAAPVIIAPDADLEDNIPLIAKGGFYHAGQVCVSVQRVFAHASIAQQVANGLAEHATQMKIGDPTSSDTEVGPLIRPQEVNRVEQWVSEAVQSGADLVCGGQRLSERTYQCTVLLNPPSDAKLSREEIFGPVVCVYAYNDIEDAIECANALPFAFQSAVITQNIDTALQCVNQLDAAAVMVNDHTAFRVDWMPFAGHKQSGYGTGGAAYSLDDMQAEKLVVIRSKQI